MKISIVDAALIILTAIALILVASKIFGSSPTELQVMMGLFSILFGFMGKLYFALNKLNREVGELKTEMRHRFEKLESELKK